MSKPGIDIFLSYLASTQTQAESALSFLYREVLGVELPWLEDIEQAKTPNGYQSC